MMMLTWWMAATLAAAEIQPAQVDKLIADAMTAWKTPGVAVAIVQDDKVVYLKGHGVKELGKPEPVTPDSLFEIASTTKAFTTAALAMLVEEGKLAWDDPVRKHLEYFHLADPLADQNVTVRDLVCHRTGLPRHDALWYKTPLSREEIVRRAGGLPLNKQFRQEYQYQNIMFIAAGELIGKVAGKPWDEFVRERIFTPLAMKNTTTRYAVAVRNADRAMPHRRLKDGQVAPIEWVNFDNVGAAGCINSSARDLAEWARFQLKSKTVAETHLPQMAIRPDKRGRELSPASAQVTYGLGWRIEHYRGEMLVAHAGALDGFRSSVTLVPARKLGIVILTNLGPTNLSGVLAQTLVDHAAGLPWRDWNAEIGAVVKRHESEDEQRKKDREAKRPKGTKPARELAAYAGKYTAPGYGDMTIALKDGRLTAEWLTMKAKLEHVLLETFTGKEGTELNPHPLDDEEFVFRLDGEGAVSGVRLMNQEFKRAK